MAEPIAVTVVGGYLGAGKTTLLNHILRSSPERVAVLVNDFGSINIDEELIIASADDKITLANGCICCSLADGFATALDILLESANPPNRLVIEASGVGDPAQIAAYGHAPGLRLDLVIVVADAELVQSHANDRYVGNIVQRQLSAADLVLVNKADLVSESDLASVHSWLGHLAPDAALVSTVQAQLPIEAFLGAESDIDPESGSSVDPESESGVGSEPRVQPESYIAKRWADRFESWSYESQLPLVRHQLESALDDLPAGVVRVKGIVRFKDSPGRQFVVHVVGTRVSIQPTERAGSGASRLVAIGARGALDPGWLQRKLRRSDRD